MKKHKTYWSILLLNLIFGLIFSNPGFGQLAETNVYLPSVFQKEGWKIKAELFAGQTSASNTFNGAFVKQVNQSGHLSSELIDTQFENFSGKSLLNSRQLIGGGLWFGSGKQKSRLFYYFGFEHQYILNAAIDDDLLRLLFKGNSPYAGQGLNLPDNQYSSIYFNQLKGGIGFVIGNEKVKHTFIGKYALNFGQNYNEVQIQNSSLYTHPEGDFLDLDINASIKMSDTVWSEFYKVNGMGFSADLFYSLSKDKDFYFSVDVRNLGFINWNKNTLSASVDTAFVFEGSLNDSLNTGQNLPDELTYNSLRGFIFSNEESVPFSTVLPVSIAFSGGKYFGGGKIYTGVQGKFYAIKQTAYSLELFATWNPNDLVSFTPIICYNNYSGVDFGLAFSARITDYFYLMAGASGLGSFVNEESLAGSGGFVRLIFSM